MRLAALILAGCLAPAAATAAAAAPAPVEIVIVESHDRALLHWVEAAERGRLPRSGVTVVHFDAHPDLEIPPRPVPARWPPNPAWLMSMVQIGSFQIAALRIGLVERVVWLRPAWAGQIPDGERRFWLGTTPSGALRATDESDYYVLLDGWAPLEALGPDRTPVALRVLALDDAARAAPLVPHDAAILDIDLDGFATRNPGADRLRAAGLADAEIARLRRLFEPSGLGLAAEPARRQAQLGELHDALGALAAARWSELPGALWVLWERGLGPLDLLDLYRILSHADPNASLAELLEAGQQAVGSPERAADPGEIERSARRLGELVASGALRPRLVTIARSVRDGFTPAAAWPRIEWTLLEALTGALGAHEIRFDAGLGPAPRPDAPHRVEPR